jgi:hypothetical protein
LRGSFHLHTSGRPISRILSSRGLVYAPKSFFPALHLDGHLSVQPTQDSNDASSVSSLLGLAPGWGYLAAGITASAGGLLHRLFTMTALQRLFVSVALSGKLPRPGVSPVPCSVECGLSSTLRRSTGPRPSSRPEAISSYLFLEYASITGKGTIVYNMGTRIHKPIVQGETHDEIS